MTQIQTLDRLFDIEKRAFKYARRVETQYAVALRSIAKHIGEIVRYFHDETATGSAYVRAALNKYSELLDPWAKSVAHKMITETAARDRSQWAAVSRSMRRNLLAEIDRAPIANRFSELMDQQVTLIKSIPLDAAQDVHDLVIAGLSNAQRPPDVAKHIEGVSRSRANLIARTESTRAATTLLQARSEWIGSEEYIWRTSEDADVRPDHRILDGKAFRWDSPPIADRRTGARAHPGCIYNCRCVAGPIIADIK